MLGHMNRLLAAVIAALVLGLSFSGCESTTPGATTATQQSSSARSATASSGATAQPTPQSTWRPSGARQTGTNF
jgi:hypothetical protein